MGRPLRDVDDSSGSVDSSFRSTVRILREDVVLPMPANPGGVVAAHSSVGAPPRPAGEVRPWVIIAVVVPLAVIAALVAADFVVLEAFHSEPSGFYPVGDQRATAGSTGCAPTAGEICYAVTFGTLYTGLTLANIHFAVGNDSEGTPTGTAGPAIPLGPSAQVSALGGSGAVAGVWSFSSATWVAGADAGVPTDTDIVAVLDTGLTSNATLVNAEFLVILTGPETGAVGFGLY